VVPAQDHRQRAGLADLLHRILAVNAASVAAYLNAQIEAGAQAVMIFDTWGGALAHDAFRQFSLRYTGEVIAQLTRQRDGEPVPVICFTKGGGLWLEDIAQLGCDAVGLDWTADLGAARRRIDDRCALQGNLDPMVLFAGEQAIRAEALRVLQSFGSPRRADGGLGGHVFNLGHGISQFTPPEAVTVLVDTVHAESRRMRASANPAGLPR
jgi:uroporphyrinogen decarboxylase